MDMGHNTLSDKLDQIQKEELGIHFNDSLLWEELNGRMEIKKAGFDFRLLIAACISLMILFSPFILVNNQTELGSEISSLTPIQKTEPIPAEPMIVEDQTLVKTAVHDIKKRPIDIGEKEVAEIGKLVIHPIEVQEYTKQKRQLFANEDISIIQANLGTPSIEKGKSVTIRAQFHASSQPVELNNQELKIKLFEVSNQ
jgi:hypothetical protein